MISEVIYFVGQFTLVISATWGTEAEKSLDFKSSIVALARQWWVLGDWSGWLMPHVWSKHGHT